MNYQFLGSLEVQEYLFSILFQNEEAQVTATS